MKTGINRRMFLRGLGVAAALPVLGSVPVAAQTAAPGVPPGMALWSDPNTWPNRRVPGPSDRVVVDRPVLLDTDARVARLEIGPAGVLMFAPGLSARLSTSGNVVVRGMLRMNPGDPSLQHALTFVDVHHNRYRGGGMEILESDVGLWVVGDGKLLLEGSPKTSWTTLPTGHAAGERVAMPYPGWRAGDRVVLTPTVPPASSKHTSPHASRYDDSMLDGALVSGPLAHAHPLVANRWGAEALNLTRNVVIEGLPDRHAHIMVMSRQPQQLRNVELRHLGVPRKVGRYVLHFHMMGDGSRGSLVEDVVAHNCGNHVFVPHASHGITFRGCVSHDTLDDAFWWDERPFVGARGDDVPQTHATLFDRCVASLVRPVDKRGRNRLSGFTLGRGDANACRNSVAVGVIGRKNSAGFRWPEMNISIKNNIWAFDNNLAHNCLANGINSWQNDREVHLVERFVAYHNGRAGIDHGAYSNRYHYRDLTLYGNAATGMTVHAVSPSNTEPLTFERVAVDGAGLGGSGLVSVRHHGAHDGTVLVKDCDFRNVGVAMRFVAERRARKDGAERYHVVNCGFAGQPFVLGDTIHPDSLIVVEDATRLLELRRRDQPGEYNAEWNASVRHQRRPVAATASPAAASAPAPAATVAVSAAGPAGVDAAAAGTHGVCRLPGAVTQV